MFSFQEPDQDVEARDSLEVPLWVASGPVNQGRVEFGHRLFRSHGVHDFRSLFCSAPENDSSDLGSLNRRSQHSLPNSHPSRTFVDVTKGLPVTVAGRDDEKSYTVHSNKGGAHRMTNSNLETAGSIPFYNMTFQRFTRSNRSRCLLLTPCGKHSLSHFHPFVKRLKPSLCSVCDQS